MALAGRIFSSDLVAINALDRETFIGFVCTELNAYQLTLCFCGMYITSTNALWTSSRGGAGMLELGVCLGVGFGLLAIGLGAGVTDDPFVCEGGSDCLFCSGVPFRTAEAPLRALVAPSREKVPPYPGTSEDDDGGRGPADCVESSPFCAAG